ncbi:hypothetical protein WR25_16118 [Diploscapter pachys]|uniref:UDP-N-acetylglucosamine 4-epimerase n=1 Tax=Diploscapter pachys TaxID=2018661 RepID=A0A2A2LB60_9BILA|nr:hypothetical protein WR25_16118 [Diploscapter pachys]
MSQKQLDSVTKALSTYPGRDKAIRSLAFYLLLHAPGSVRQKELQALAKQLSGCRLVMRQFNHPSMIKACQMLLQTKKGDPIEYYAGAGVTIIYTVYGVAELIAWLADAGILALDAARWYRYCLYLWIGGMKILVTGAAGFIGSHTVLELVESGYDVFCIDNFVNAVADDQGRPVSLLRVAEITGKQIPFEKCDVCDINQLDEIFKKHKFDGLIHLAALKAVGESVAKPYDYYSNNLVASLNLIKMCQKYGVKNFIFSSSATVYGPPKELPITENSPTGQGITNPYGQTKYMMEQILIDVGKAEPDWNIVLLRYFNPVGAHKSGKIGEDPKGVPNNLMPFVSQVAIGKLPVLTIYGDKFDTPDGTGVRDYIHIVDLAKGHVKALDRIKAKGHIGTEIYNLGTGTGYSVKEMVAAMEKASGRKISTKIGVPRPGDVATVYCDPALAKEKLNWQAEFGLDDMCCDLWRWQTQNPNGFLEA